METGSYELALNRIIIEVYHLLKDDESGHDFGHCMIVLNHVIQALVEMDGELSEQTKFAIKCAAILHEADDEKIVKTENYFNARSIIKELNLETWNIGIDNVDEFIELVISMIDKVSTRSNGICTVGEPWELIVSMLIN